jgi:hypothetical protein
MQNRHIRVKLLSNQENLTSGSKSDCGTRKALNKGYPSEILNFGEFMFEAFTSEKLCHQNGTSTCAGHVTELGGESPFTGRVDRNR